MPKEDSAIDPKPTISLMFAISVGFWASQLATYITPMSEIARLRTEAKELQAWVNTKVNTHVENFKDKFRKREIASKLQPKIRRIQTVMQSEVRETLRNYINDTDGFIRSSAEDRQGQQEGTQEKAQADPNESKRQDPNESKRQDPNESKRQDPNESKGQDPNESKGQDPNESKPPEVKLLSDIKGHLESYVKELELVKSNLYDDADDLKDQIINKLNKYVNKISPTNRKWQWWLTLGSGLLFLIDLLCILWWYARYIYRVQPKARFWTYFLDFVICSMFALAANSWTKPKTFMFATLCGSGFLIFRFVLLYLGSSASQTDRYILKVAGFALLLAVPISAGCLLGVDKLIQNSGIEIYICGPALPGVLSLIGIVLTICLKTKIDVAVAIYSARFAPISPAYLAWPAVPKSEEEEVESQHARIRHRVKAGLEDFNNLFHQFRKHDRIYSRVHSATELRVQSYILALPSCEEENYASEIENKALMVAVSHWLDDLVDGRNELFVYKQLQKYKNLHHDPPLSDDLEHAKKLFTQIYRPLIIRYTDRNFYDRLYDKICECCSLSFNRKYMLLGLNRVACGAAVFSPKLAHAQRRRILADHNDFLKVWNVEEKGKFEDKVEQIINKISVGDEAGPILLGLTTKTVQEVALSSEKPEFNIGLSILLSILYAPLIYYHDIMQELDNDEMIQLQSLDTDSDLWMPWLWEVCEILKEFKDKDERHTMRIKQIEMAYSCFRPKLPDHTKPELDKIYLEFPWDSKKIEHETTDEE